MRVFEFTDMNDMANDDEEESSTSVSAATVQRQFMQELLPDDAEEVVTTPLGRANGQRLYAKPTVQHESSKCGFSESNDRASRLAVEHWRERSGRMNVLTQTAMVPCDMLSLTRQRIQMESLVKGLIDMQEEVTKIDTKLLAAANEPTDSTRPILIAVKSVSTSTRPNKIAEHDTLDRPLTLANRHEKWQKAKQDAAGTTMTTHMTRVKELLAKFEQGRESIEYVMKTAHTLVDCENQLTQQMYPATAADIKALLIAHDVVPASGQPALIVQSIDDFCVLCRDRDAESLYVKIAPRCNMHTGCITARRSGSPCKCRGTLYYHLDCLSGDMLAQYKGSRNDGVGRSLLLCPTCRGTYCFNDLVSLRIMREVPPVVQQTSSATKKTEAPVEEADAAKPVVKKAKVMITKANK